ncbi:hypothetical protein [Streptococcus fryi]
MKKELSEAINELVNFLYMYRLEENVSYFIEILQEMSKELEKSEATDETLKKLKTLYKSMFFPRGGLSDFYILNNDSVLMKKYNEQYVFLVKKISDLLNC